MPDESRRQPQTNPIHHEGGDPASLKQDPAQAYPTGGAGLIPHPPSDSAAGPASEDPSPTHSGQTRGDGSQPR